MTTPTPEAIEAAARALYDSEWGAYANWELTKADDKAYWRLQATAALTAAAPFNAAHAKAEALREAADALPGLRRTDTGYSDINGDHRRWLRARAATIEGESE